MDVSVTVVYEMDFFVDYMLSIELLGRYFNQRLMAVICWRWFVKKKVLLC